MSVESVDTERLLGVLLEAATLKWLPRLGWQMRGVPLAESVADHSYGVSLTTLVLAGALAEDEAEGLCLDLQNALIIALLHDLSEVRLTDLPASAVRLVGAKAKAAAEGWAMAELLATLPDGERLLRLWHEFEEGSTVEGRLVRDADKLEMMVQCLRYEQAGCRGLDEFWQAMDRHHWHFALSAGLYARLRERRKEGNLGA